MERSRVNRVWEADCFTDLRLVSISKNARPCKTSRCDHYPSSGPAKYVLELNAGQADRLGLQPGAVLTLHLQD
ncbi:MAG: DUF192 domain-containing protein [Gammaproteobacteria bacterium]|nr:DUF192 domain-containing protein [Gammaproteobacteria bacterium]